MCCVERRAHIYCSLKSHEHHKAKEPAVQTIFSLVVLVAALTLTSCASAPEPRSEAQLATELGVDPKTVVSQYRCFHSISPKGARSASHQDSMCLRTRDRLVFGRYDKQAGRYVVSAALPFKSITAIRFHSYALARQIQLETDAGVHGVYARPESTLWVKADRDTTDAEYAAMAKLGVPTGDAPFYIRDSNSTTTVPIFIPSR
jgi:hypothetical protein